MDRASVEYQFTTGEAATTGDLTTMKMGRGGALAPAPGTAETTDHTRPQLGLDVTELGGAAIVRVAGFLTPSDAEPLRAAIEVLLDTELAVIVLDLHDLIGIDSAGVAVLAQLNRQAQDRCAAVRIIANNPAVLIPLTRSHPAELDVWDTSGRLKTVRPSASREPAPPDG